MANNYPYVNRFTDDLYEGLAGSYNTPTWRTPLRRDQQVTSLSSAGARKSPAPIVDATIQSTTLPAGSTSSSLGVEPPEVPGSSKLGEDPPNRDFAEGPSRPIANISAIGNLALGLAGYFENRKTAGLQRDALKHNIATAKEHSANRRALGASWANAWS